MTGSRAVAMAFPARHWHDVVELCAREAGPFPAPRLLGWQAGVDAVEARIGALQRATRYLPDQICGADRGVHALVALAAARREAWVAEDCRTDDRLVDIATAVELAYLATRHHDEVRDQRSSSREANRRHVLDGDWSITQAAVLAADVGPGAYQLLVRGYGAAQLARLEMVAAPAVPYPAPQTLLGTAAMLGALVSGVVEADRGDSTVPDVVRVLAWARKLR